jgi:uncharacterized lipoprotein YddW (UPF0748 family)
MPGEDEKIMKRLRCLSGQHILWTTFCLVVVSLAVGVQAQTVSPVEYNRIYGMWVEARGRNFTTAEESSALIETLRQYNFNALFPQVYAGGSAFYRSRIVPRATRIDTTYLDPLGDLVVQAHAISVSAQPLTVHAVLSVFRAYESWAEPIPPIGNVARTHPDWLTESYQGKQLTGDKAYYLDPGVPEVQNYIIMLVMEVVTNYDIDGVCLVDMCYPESGREWGYNPSAVERFNAQYQREGKPLPDDPQWCQWRQDQLTQLLHRLYSTLRSVKPGVDLAVAVDVSGEPPETADEFATCAAFYRGLQNWVEWAKEGIVDVICLKNFWQGEPRGTAFVQWTDFALQNKGQAKVLVGIAGFLNFADAILPQVRIATAHGADGIVLFNYRNPTKSDRTVFFQTVKATVFSDSYVGIPPSGIPRYEPPKISLEHYTTPTLVEVFSTSVETSPTVLVPTAVPSVSPSPFEVPPELGETPVQPLVEVTPTTPVLMATPVATAEPTTPSVKAEITPSPAPTLTPTPVVTYELPPAPPWDTIYLKNGNSVRGRVIEEINGETLIETESGLRLKIGTQLIERVEKGSR